MSDHIQKTIVDLQQHMKSLEDEVADTKKTINSLCKTIGKPPLYANVDVKSSIGGGPLRSDLYYGKPLATVVRSILEARQTMNLGPATVADIYQRMLEGGFVFDGENVDNRKRVLRISLSKNTSVFHKLPNGSYGLLEWYPAVKPSRKNGAAKTEDEEDDASDDQDEEVAGQSEEGDGGEAQAVTASSGSDQSPKKPK